MHDILKQVLNARVNEVLPEPTPLHRAPQLSQRWQREIYLKREDLTPVFSFKVRGAYNRIAHLDDAQLARGILAASAGNHAQGVAFACRRRGTNCRIVMPATTPAIKVSAVESYGAQIELVGDSYSDAAARCQEVAQQTGMTVIPPFDDDQVIAGQGTVGLEILRQVQGPLKAVFVPIGGGGLISGVAAVIKELRPEVLVIGVEPYDSDAMYQSMLAGQRVVLPRVGIFADGVAVRQVGERTLPLCQRYVDEIIRVDHDEICAAIKDGFLETRALFEPAGALALAGLKRWAATHQDDNGALVAVASGANVSLSRLGHIAERAEVGERREALLAVTIAEQQGAFLRFCRLLGTRAITEFSYRLSSRVQAHVFVGVAVNGADEIPELCQYLSNAGVQCNDLSDDDLAKTHVRHMVGGHAESAKEEVLYCFEFPERRGALLQFLERLNSRWNISLFHYRSDGGGFGRVLCGFEVPTEQQVLLNSALEGLGFEYRPVHSVAASHFLTSSPTVGAADQ